MIHKKNNKLNIFLLSFLIPVMVLIFVCIFQKIYPFGDNTIMTGDITYQFIDYLAYFKTIFFTNNDFSYTFSKTIGGDMVGFSSYYLSSPFNLIMLLFPNNLLPLALLIMIIMKCGLCGLSFNYMITKLYGTRYQSLIFSTSYALMGYTIVYYQLFAYFDNLMLLPLIVLGIHKIMDNPKKKSLYLISLCASIFINYYIGWMLCIFSVLYFAYQIILTTESIHQIKNKIRIIKSFLISSIIAGGLTACSLIPSLLSLRGEKNSFHLGFYRTFRFIDLFSRFYTNSFKGNISSCLPNIYCGVLIIFLFLVFLLNKKISKKERISSFLFIVFLMCNFYVNTLNIVWHGFNQPIGFPYRYSFLLSFLMILFSYKGFINRNNESLLKGWLLILISYISYSIYILVRGSEVIGFKEIIIDGIYLVIIILIVELFSLQKMNTRLFILLLFLLQLSDLSFNAVDSFQYFSFASMKEYQNYLNEIGDVIDTIKEEDDGFYRIEKYFRRSHNDAMQFNYNGLTHYSSSEKKENISFMGKLGFRDNGNWSFYNSGSTSFIDSLFGVKYVISQFDTISKPYNNYLNINKYSIYKNQNALPFLFASGPDIVHVSYNEDNLFEIQNNIADSINNKTNHIYVPTQKANVNLSNLNVKEEDDILTYSKINKEVESYVEYQIPITSDNSLNVYFSAPSLQNVTIYLNNEEIGNYFDKYKWDIMDLGSFSIGDVVSIKIVNHENDLKISNSYFYYEDYNSICNWYQEVSKNKCELNKITSSHLIGTAEVNPGYEYLVLSIPYDKGWKLYIDGKKVETIKAVNILLAAKVSEGTHQIELVFIPEGKYLGTIITTLFFILFVVIILKDSEYMLSKKKIQKNRKRN